jgi:hypothetical protein
MTDPIDPALLERARQLQLHELKRCDFCREEDCAHCDCIQWTKAIARFAQRERLEAEITGLEMPYDAACERLKVLRAQRDKGGA